MVVAQDILFRRSAEGIPNTTYGTFGLYRYPAKFIPQVIDYVLREYATPGMSVFDPFAGYGTVGVVSRLHGVNYELWDLNPMIEILHTVATMPMPEVDVELLVQNMKVSQDNFVPDWPNVGYWFPEMILPLLYRVWGFYHALTDIQAKQLLVIPLIRATRHFSYNDAPRQKLSKSPRAVRRVEALLDADWEEAFFTKVTKGLQAVVKGLTEYNTLSPDRNVESVIHGGTDTLTASLEKPRDILITSPPYLQAQEYIRHAKMDLFWLGFSAEQIKDLGHKEVPYRAVEVCPIYSETFHKRLSTITEPSMKRVFERYFYGILGSLTRLQESINEYLCLFVGSASLRGESVPIDTIFAEHFSEIGWTHEATLSDTIVARQMFFYDANPATGIVDSRMRTEQLLVLSKKR